MMFLFDKVNGILNSNKEFMRLKTPILIIHVSRENLKYYDIYHF